MTSLHYVMQQTQHSRHWTEHFQLSVYYVRNFEISQLIIDYIVMDNGARPHQNFLTGN